MKQAAYFIIVFFLSSSNGFGQHYGGFEHGSNINSGACLDEKSRSVLLEMIEANRSELYSLGILKRHSVRNFAPPKFIFPLRAANGLSYQNFYGISNYVDHDQRYGSDNERVEDFNCGRRSYDTENGYNHRGIDYYTFPFPWNVMDNDQVEVIAAAPGTITLKIDGYQDKNCAWNGTQWNIVVVQHEDGSSAWYGHLKKNTLTTKELGDTVDAGDYLGVVGSSGNSTSPHLHFEIYDNQDRLVDPYAGPCNSTIGESWWQNQHEYNDSKINLIQTQTKNPKIPSCPPLQQGISYSETEFETGDTIFLVSYFTDYLRDMNIHHALIRPDGSTYREWDFSRNIERFSWAYWWWDYVLPETELQGLWTYQVIFNQDTAMTNFVFGSITTSSDPPQILNFKISPNPFSNQITIQSTSKIQKSTFLNIYNLLGENIFYTKLSPEVLDYKLNLDHLPQGIFVLQLTNGTGNRFASTKIVKK